MSMGIKGVKVLFLAAAAAIITAAVHARPYDNSIMVQYEVPGYNIPLVGYNRDFADRMLTLSIYGGGYIRQDYGFGTASADIHYNFSEVYCAGLGNSLIALNESATGSSSAVISFAEPQAGVHIDVSERISLFVELGYILFYSVINRTGAGVELPARLVAEAGAEWWF